jgi:hypothetical protein
VNLFKTTIISSLLLCNFSLSASAINAEFAIDTCRTLEEVSVVALKQEEKLRSEAVSATAVGRVRTPPQ